MLDKSQYNILIVEDDIINLQFMKTSLISLGFKNIYQASNANKALEVIKETKIDVVFMDINIEGAIDGIACAHLINQNRNIPIIYTTAYSDTETIIDASDTNICSYLIKPFDQKDIEINLYIALKKHHNINLKKEKNLLLNISSKFKFDLKEKILYENNRIQDITNKEKEILFLLCENINSNISYDMFRENIWDGNVSDSTIRDTIFRLRKKVPDLDIKSITGIGYRLQKELDV